MDNQAEDSVRTNMESLRKVCEKEIHIEQRKMEVFSVSFLESLGSIRAKAQENVQCQGKLSELKAKLRESEDDLVKALAVKTRMEAKRMAVMDSIATTKARVEKLRLTLQYQKTMRDEYAAIVSQQFGELAMSEEKDCRDRECKDEIQEAISWYNRVLDIHIEGGYGVKFTFKKISAKNPDEEFSFTIRHADDTYTLLDCSPQLNGIKELIRELNKTNGLFKFVRIMREKFQEAAGQGRLSESADLHLDFSVISMSAPVLSASTDRSESSTEKAEQNSPAEEANRRSKKDNSGKALKSAVLSPGSASSLRRSSRKVKK